MAHNDSMRNHRDPWYSHQNSPLFDMVQYYKWLLEVALSQSLKGEGELLKKKNDNSSAI